MQPVTPPILLEESKRLGQQSASQTLKAIAKAYPGKPVWHLVAGCVGECFAAGLPVVRRVCRRLDHPWRCRQCRVVRRRSPRFLGGRRGSPGRGYAHVHAHLCRPRGASNSQPAPATPQHLQGGGASGTGAGFRRFFRKACAHHSHCAGVGCRRSGHAVGDRALGRPGLPARTAAVRYPHAGLRTAQPALA